MIKKQFVKTRKMYRVTFEMPKDHLPEEVDIKKMALVGDFNEWSEKSTPMVKLKNGKFKVVVDLEPGKSYQYRYLANGDLWINDWEADDYQPNQIEGDNCVLVLP